MSAKILQALSDENPELKKQIGCMTGIFQLFDRNHIISSKRIHAHKRLPPGMFLSGFSVSLFIFSALICLRVFQFIELWELLFTNY